MLPNFFAVTFKNYKGFTVNNATKSFKEVSDFDFDTWKKIGSSNAAEIQASEDLRTALSDAFDSMEADGGSIPL